MPQLNSLSTCRHFVIITINVLLFLSMTLSTLCLPAEEEATLSTFIQNPFYLPHFITWNCFILSNKNNRFRFKSKDPPSSAPLRRSTYNPLTCFGGVGASGSGRRRRKRCMLYKLDKIWVKVKVFCLLHCVKAMLNSSVMKGRGCDNRRREGESEWGESEWGESEWGESEWEYSRERGGNTYTHTHQ